MILVSMRIIIITIARGGHSHDVQYLELRPGSQCGHEVTAEFRRSQFVTPVAALSIVHMGVTTPCIEYVLSAQGLGTIERH